MFEIRCEKLVANERATRRSSDLRSSMPPRVTFHNASSSSSSSILDDLSASLMSLFKQPANNVPLNKKCEAFTAQLGVEGDSIHDTVHATAAALGVATEGKHLNALADECWHVIFGGEEAAPSDGFKDNDEMDLSEDSTVASVMDRLTAGEQHAECCICFDELHERVVASFSYQGKRTCPHFFHDDCAAQLLQSGAKACPICRRKIDLRMRVPKATDDPKGWFKCIDVESNGKVTRGHVMAVLVSQFPIDHVKLEEELPTLWTRWDTDGDGFLTMEEVIGGEHSLLHFVTTQLLKQPAGTGVPPPPTQVQLRVPDGAQPGQEVEFAIRGQRVRIKLPPRAKPGMLVMVNLPPMPPPLAPQTSFQRSPKDWFEHFADHNSRRLARSQLLRALVKTNPSYSLVSAGELISNLELLPPQRAGGRESNLTLEQFLSIHEILKQAVESA